MTIYTKYSAYSLLGCIISSPHGGEEWRDGEETTSYYVVAAVKEAEHSCSRFVCVADYIADTWLEGGKDGVHYGRAGVRG